MLSRWLHEMDKIAAKSLFQYVLFYVLAMFICISLVRPALLTSVHLLAWNVPLKVLPIGYEL